MERTIFNFYWGDSVDEEQLVEIEGEEGVIRKHLKEYIAENIEEYNIDDFVLYLKDKGINCKTITVVVNMFF